MAQEPRLKMESRSPTRPMTVMTATERQLTRHIIEERDERVKAINDLWAKLQDLQQEVQRVRMTPCDYKGPKTLPAEAIVELDTLKAELAAQRSQLAGHCAAMDGSLEALRCSVQRAEAEVREGRMDLNALAHRFAELRESRTKAIESSKATSGTGLEPQRALELAGAPAGELTASLTALRNKVRDLEMKQQQQVKELAALRSVLIEVHVNLPLHAVRASRIALRSTELSREERKLALSSLEAKEQQIRFEIDKVRERNDQYPAFALPEVRGVDLGAAPTLGSGP